jgi:hypothetical protein
LGWLRPRAEDSPFKTGPGSYKTYIYPWNITLHYHLLPNSWFIPYIGGGAGVTYWNLRDISEKDQWFPVPPSGTSLSGTQSNFTLVGCTGFSLFFSKTIGLNLSFRYLHLLDQNSDNIGTGDVNDHLLEARLILSLFLGGHKDSDGDGIENKLDSAPYQPEDFDQFMDEDGVPDLDNDNDGIPDDLDLAPNLAEDMDGFKDEDGIPDLDNDHDGLTDDVDQCPMDPEDIDGFEDEDGCPDLDNDKDGIPDTADNCPDQMETFNNYQDDDGCPDEKEEIITAIEEGAPLVLEGVNFETGKATLTENAKKILDKVHCKQPKSFPEKSGIRQRLFSQKRHFISKIKSGRLW